MKHIQFKAGEDLKEAEAVYLGSDNEIHVAIPAKKNLSWKWFLFPLLGLTTFHATMYAVGNYPIEFCIGLGIISLACWILFYVLTNIIINLSK
jgi:hypothetical protein